MKERKFKWFHGLVLAVILLLIAGTAVKFLVLDPSSRNKAHLDISYEIKITGVRQYTVDAIEAGDTLYDNSGKGEVGQIAEIRTEQATSLCVFPDGTTDWVPMEDRFDVYLTVRAQAVEDEGEYRVGAYTMRVNQFSTYFTKYSIWSGRIMEIREGAS